MKTQRGNNILSSENPLKIPFSSSLIRELLNR